MLSNCNKSSCNLVFFLHKIFRIKQSSFLCLAWDLCQTEITASSRYVCTYRECINSCKFKCFTRFSRITSLIVDELGTFPRPRIRIPTVAWAALLRQSFKPINPYRVTSNQIRLSAKVVPVSVFSDWMDMYFVLMRFQCSVCKLVVREQRWLHIWAFKYNEVLYSDRIMSVRTVWYKYFIIHKQYCLNLKNV